MNKKKSTNFKTEFANKKQLQLNPMYNIIMDRFIHAISPLLEEIEELENEISELRGKAYIYEQSIKGTPSKEYCLEKLRESKKYLSSDEIRNVIKMVGGGRFSEIKKKDRTRLLIEVDKAIREKLKRTNLRPYETDHK